MKKQLFCMGKISLMLLLLTVLSAFEVPCDDPDYGTGPYDCEAPLDQGLLCLIMGILFFGCKKLSTRLKITP